VNKEELEKLVESQKLEIKGLHRVVRDLVDLLKEKHVRPEKLEKLEKKAHGE
jgi:hypothetical protein